MQDAATHAAVGLVAALGVAVMSLSAREHRTLDSIENELAGSDPNLAALLATFTRLTSGEEMPAREEIRSGEGPNGIRRLVRDRQHPPRYRGPRRAHRPCHRLGWQLAGLLLSLLVAVGLSAVVVVGRGRSAATCVHPWSLLVCAPRAPAHSARPGARKTAAGRPPRSRPRAGRSRIGGRQTQHSGFWLRASQSRSVNLSAALGTSAQTSAAVTPRASRTC
jgi:Protein of unknown function (DUF3040)